MKHKIKVIFVCTGNICRSPTAEAVFKHLIKQQALADNFIVKSAGTHAMVGYFADERSSATAKDYGISLKGIISEQFTKQDGLDFDYIVALDKNNYNYLSNNVKDKTKLLELAKFVKSEKLESIPDPYYNDNFDYVFIKIEEALNNLLNYIKKGALYD